MFRSLQLFSTISSHVQAPFKRAFRSIFRVHSRPPPPLSITHSLLNTLALRSFRNLIASSSKFSLSLSLALQTAHIRQEITKVYRKHTEKTHIKSCNINV